MKLIAATKEHLDAVGPTELRERGPEDIARDLRTLGLTIDRIDRR